MTIITLFRLICEFILRCMSGHCNDELLLDTREYRCCKEILKCTGKFTFNGKDAECITQHWDYVVATHRTLPETAGAFLFDKSGKKYQKPTIRTQDRQLIQQLFKKKAFDGLASKQNYSQ